ncbi:hypothetical protein ACFQVD_18510 [Streptosporangium amethystogenes subsp. fukuiense]|uniref:Uncharacterized protein n=1 Tax=Streptosporangium amethystogenes subsp. fukuiense TaxID=698418 RepID=A0ABW2T0H0_9ACTN
MRAVLPDLGHKGACSTPVEEPIGRPLHDPGVPPGTTVRATGTGRGGEGT